MDDVLIIGSGPAGAALASSLCALGLKVSGLTPGGAETPWRNRYGIWADDLRVLGMERLLGHRWEAPIVFAGGLHISLPRAYGLFDNPQLQAHLTEPARQAGMVWHAGAAARVDHGPDYSRVVTRGGETLAARLVVDASGHSPALINRPPGQAVAYQAAYGITGLFSNPPIPDGSFVLMDYRAGHLPTPERAEPPSFLYAMDFRDGSFFVEETCLASAPALSLEVLESRLVKRLESSGTRLLETLNVERVLFPMDLPLPDLSQPVMGYGGAASMVHPATGYQVGAALRFAPVVAQAIRAALDLPLESPPEIARAAWKALWPPARIQTRSLYLFGLRTMMKMSAGELSQFFASFFDLPFPLWSGYLSDRLSRRQILQMMALLFARTTRSTRRALIRGALGEFRLLRGAFR